MSMGAARKFAIGLGLAGGALLTAWFLSGNRARRTRDFLVKKVQHIKTVKKVPKKDLGIFDETDVHYI